MAAEESGRNWKKVSENPSASPSPPRKAVAEVAFVGVLVPVPRPLVPVRVEDWAHWPIRAAKARKVSFGPTCSERCRTLTVEHISADVSRLPSSPHLPQSRNDRPQIRLRLLPSLRVLLRRNAIFHSA